MVPDAAPDLTKPEAGAPALTLVFDREGWSPDLFKRLARRGIACITGTRTSRARTGRRRISARPSGSYAAAWQRLADSGAKKPLIPI